MIFITLNIDKAKPPQREYRKNKEYLEFTWISIPGASLADSSLINPPLFLEVDSLVHRCSWWWWWWVDSPTPASPLLWFCVAATNSIILGETTESLLVSALVLYPFTQREYRTERVSVWTSYKRKNSTLMWILIYLMWGKLVMTDTQTVFGMNILEPEDIFFIVFKL